MHCCVCVFVFCLSTDEHISISRSNFVSFCLYCSLYMMEYIRFSHLFAWITNIPSTMTPVSVNFIGIHFFELHWNTFFSRYNELMLFISSLYHLLHFKWPYTIFWYLGIFFWHFSKKNFDFSVERLLTCFSILILTGRLGMYDIQLDFHFNFFSPNKQIIFFSKQTKIAEKEIFFHM